MQLSHYISHTKAVQWLIFAIACLVYANTLPNKWAVDDGIIIQQNKQVQQGVSGLPALFMSDAFAGFYGENINVVTGGRYRPLTQAWFAINAELFADDKLSSVEKKPTIDANRVYKELSAETNFPNILHAFNTLWYGLLCLILYRTLLLMLQLKWGSDSHKIGFIAFISSLLFAVHPLHTEVVANIKGLDEILALLGALVSLYCVLQIFIVTNEKGENKHKTKWLIVAIISYFLALLAKESAVTFIVIIPLALWFFTTASAKNIFKLTLPLFVPLVLFLGIRTAVLYQPNKGAIAEELMNDPFLVLDPNAQYAPLIENSSIKKLVNPNANTFTQMPYKNQLATNFYTYGVYLKLLFVPANLTVDYYPRHIEIKSFSNLSVLLSLVAHLSLLIWAFFNIRKRKIIAFGILYYFITFSIVSNLFFPIGTNMAERFMFMPSLGFCLIVAVLLYALGKKLSQPNTTSGFLKVTVLLTVITVLFSYRTFSRNFDWKDNYTLFSKDILVSKNSGKINTDLAAEIIEKALLTNKYDSLTFQASEIERSELLSKAILHLHKALEIHPMSNLAWLKMANAHHFLGQIETTDPKQNLKFLQTAMAAYNEAYIYRSKSQQKIIEDFKAICLMDLGKLAGQKFGNIPLAISYLEEARKLAPNESEIYFLLGTAHSVNNNFDGTISNTKKALDLNPTNLEAKQNLAVAYQRFAYAKAEKRVLLPIAENLLLEVLDNRKKASSNDKQIIQTLDLLLKNAVIRGDFRKQELYKNEIQRINPKVSN